MHLLGRLAASVVAISLLAVDARAAPPRSHGGGVGGSALMGPLLIKEQIRDAIGLYPFLVDRRTPSNSRAEWARQMFTHDAVMEAYAPDGTLQLRLVGRAAILEKFGGTEKEGPGVGRHYLMNTTFDEVGANKVVSRTTAFSLTAMDRDGATAEQPRGTPMRVSMFVYRDVWAREDGTWKKRLSEVHFEN